MPQQDYNYNKQKKNTTKKTLQNLGITQIKPFKFLVLFKT